MCAVHVCAYKVSGRIYDVIHLTLYILVNIKCTTYIVNRRTSVYLLLYTLYISKLSQRKHSTPQKKVVFVPCGYRMIRHDAWGRLNLQAHSIKKFSNITMYGNKKYQKVEIRK